MIHPIGANQGPLLAAAKNQGNAGRTSAKGVPPSSSGGRKPPSSKLFLRDVPAKFKEMLAKPPAPQEFKHDLQFEVAEALYNSGKKGICALVRLLNAEVWMTETQLAERRDIFVVLADATGGKQTEAAREIDKDGLPCNTEFQIDLAKGKMEFFQLNESEKKYYFSLLDGFITPIDKLYSFYCLNEAAGKSSSAEALYWCNLAIMISPDLPFAYLRIIDRKDLDLQLKERYVDMWHSLNPNDIMAAYYKGECCIQRGNIVEAIGYFSRAIELSPPNPAVLYVKRGDAYLSVEMNSEALKDYLKAVELEPEAPFCSSAYLNGAVILVHQWGSFSAALEMTEKAIHLLETRSYEWNFAHRNMAVFLLALGREDEAIQTARKMFGEDPSDLYIREVLTEMLEMLPKVVLSPPQA